MTPGSCLIIENPGRQTLVHPCPEYCEDISVARAINSCSCWGKCTEVLALAHIPTLPPCCVLQHAGSSRHHRGLPYVLGHAGIFLGVAGQDTAMGMEWESPRDYGGLTEEEWKRATYPAGRIMHLVPSHLMSGEICCLFNSPPWR